MSENLNNSDDLDRLFRKKAEEYDITYNEADWARLEERLDLQEQEYTRQKRQRWIAAAVLALFALLSYFTYENHTKINDISQQLETPPQLEQRQLNQRNGSNIKTEAGNDSNITSADNTTEAPPPPSDGKSSGQSSLNLSPALQTSAHYASGDGADTETAISSVGELPCQKCMLAESSNIQNPPSTKRLTESAIKGHATPAPDLSDDNKLPSARLPSQSPNIALGFVLAPDLSTVGSISNFHNPGYKAGITIEYNFNDKFSVSTGIIQSEVRYAASGDKYNPSSGYWSYSTTPHETVGECLLLDIPLNFRYNFVQFNSSRLYTSAGISSYIMLREHYDFTYYTEDEDLARGWSGRTGTRHWLSNAGFSIGYEMDLHSKWSIRAEPFIKIPLKEVGWGNVKLYSMGTFVSVTYQLK